jgi:hypothetical protein
MTQLEKDLKLADLQTKLQMLEDERRALEAMPVTTYKVWEPGQDEEYFSSSYDGRYVNTGGSMHREYIACGLAHEEPSDAERHHAFLVMLHDLHKFAVEHNEGWKPDWKDGIANKYLVEYSSLPSWPGFSVEAYSWYYSVLPCFKSRELAQKAIDTFGERLKILFEYYNS